VNERCNRISDRFEALLLRLKANGKDGFAGIVEKLTKQTALL